MTHKQLIGILFLASCGGPAPELGGGSPGTTQGDPADPGDPDGTDEAGDETSGSSGEPSGPDLLCKDGPPLLGGDAQWDAPPFEPPTPVAGGEDDDETGGGDTGIGFIEDPDGGGVSIECSPWDQDCPRAQKCAPWANDGGEVHNASKCTPVAPDPAAHGEPCTAEGSGYSGVDDCDIGVLCHEVDRSLDGTCVALCAGNELNPLCPADHWCSIEGVDGVLALCLPDSLCADDDVCQCMCPDGGDPDCEPGQCEEVEARAALDPLALRAKPWTEAASVCPDSTDPVVRYMSNDDSNSQASPVLARRFIDEGLIVSPGIVRVHEFVNYYDLSYESPTSAPAKVGMQMRRTNADDGEFTLVVSASGRTMTQKTRPPINLVFSLDTSGSMGGEPIALLRDTVIATAASLRAGDIVSIVTWSTDQTSPLSGYVVQGPNDPELLSVAAALDANGGTNLNAGLVAAYQLANAHHIDDGINRVMLVSDGGANAGVTDTSLIASEAADHDGEGTYLIGVGVGNGTSYRDDLMDEVTDAGRGAYVYIDTPAEAARQFETHFLSNTMVVARNVRTKLTLPWYFGIKAFHGEEISSDPTEIEPQHLGPNDTMTFHQIIAACDPAQISACDQISASIEYTDPLTGEAHTDEATIPIEDVVVQDDRVLRKTDVIVGYAKALIVIGQLMEKGEQAAALEVGENMLTWAQLAAAALADPEVDEIAATLGRYVEVLATYP